MSPTDGLFIFCPKRDQRVPVSICQLKKCEHLGKNVNIEKKEGSFYCKFKGKK